MNKKRESGEPYLPPEPKLPGPDEDLPDLEKVLPGPEHDLPSEEPWLPNPEEELPKKPSPHECSV